MIFPRDFHDFPRVLTGDFASQDTDWYYPAHPWHAVVELPQLPEGEPVVIAEGEPLLAGMVGMVPRDPQDSPSHHRFIMICLW